MNRQAHQYGENQTEIAQLICNTDACSGQEVSAHHRQCGFLSWGVLGNALTVTNHDP